MEFLQNLLDNSNIPIVTAFLLGLLTALSPCPLATNITAIGFISRNGTLKERKFAKERVLWCGILYTVGRCIAYTLLGAILIYILRKGSDTFQLQQFVSEWGELIVGPALLIIGIFMIAGEFISLGGKFGFSGNKWSEKQSGPIGSFILGLLFAMAFCPTSGLLYFGMLIPMAATSSGGYTLPLVYAIATALPVLLFAWVLAYSVSSLGKLMGNITMVQKWFNRIIAVIFILVGLYYIITLI